MKHLLIFFLVATIQVIYGQSVGIGTATPDSSAILDLSSTNQGFLMPRMTTAERDLIADPKPTGLKIFNTDDNCEHIWNGEQWNRLCGNRVLSDTIRPADTWKEIDPIPNGRNRYGSFSFVFGNKIIIGLGVEQTNPASYHFLKDIWEYDVVSKVWLQKNNFPGVGRYASFAFVANGFGYIVGGHTIGSLNGDEVWEYNPNNDSWIEKNPFPSGSKTYLAGFVINNLAYLGCSNFENDFWQYNPILDSWIQKNPVPGSNRHWATGFALGNKGYIGMGRGPDASTSLSDIYEYDPDTGNWTGRQNFMSAGGPLINFVINDTAYVGLGVMNLDSESWMYKFNPNTPGNQWSQINDFSGGARYNSSVQVVNQRAYLGFGVPEATSNGINDFWVYNPKPDTLHTSIQQIQDDAYSIIDHAWTSIENTKLFTSQNFLKIGLGTHNPKTKLHIEGNNDAGLGDNSGLLMVGNIAGGNIVMDNNEILARDNGVASQIILQNHGGNTQIGGKVGLGVAPTALLHLKGLDGTSNRHIKLESNSSSDYTTLFAGTNFIIENSNAAGDFYFRGGPSNSDLFSINPEGSLNFKGSLNFNQNTSLVTTIGASHTHTTTNKSYTKMTCSSGACLTCSGSACPNLILTNGDADGHILVLRGDATANRGLYMPSNNAATTNYRLTANFQLANNNFITLMWLSAESEWREVSRSVY